MNYSTKTAASIRSDTETTTAATKRKKTGRRRRGKKDVILDFSKRAKKPAAETVGPATIKVAQQAKRTKPASSSSSSLSLRQSSSALAAHPHGASMDIANTRMASRSSKRSGGLTLTTSSKDYDGNLGLPEKITQHDYETTGQFFRRLDRLVAQARVEANMEARFNMTLPREGHRIKINDAKLNETEKLRKQSTTSQPRMQSLRHNKRKKRIKR